MRKISEASDTVGDNGMQKLFDAYQNMTIGQFRDFCDEVIANSRSSKSKKLTFKRQLHNMANKDKMVKFITNFVLSGEGMAIN
jgi:hypothetical protein